MATKNQKTNYIPIRRKLLYYVLGVVAFIAVFVLPIEFYRPIQELNQLIANAENLLAGTRGSFREEELKRLNAFVLRTLPETSAVYDEMGEYNYLAFNMLVTEEELPSEEDVLAALEDEGADTAEFDYALLEKAADYWQKAFAEDPGVQEIFSRYKLTLMGVKPFAYEIPFDLADAYIMLDIGKKEGIFADNIVFLLDGYAWWEEPSYPGEPFEITDNEFWRRSALEGREEFGHNPKHDPDNWMLPRFDEDEWGTWFGVWHTENVGDVYNIFTIDFNASSVKETIIKVSVAVGVIGLLVILFGSLVASVLGRMITRPIDELARGAREVARGNYDYVVPVIKRDELGELTESFNAMTQGQKERLNLRSTLQKLLSKELADLAGRQGLVLGGKKTDCTLVFTDFAGFSTISQWLAPNDAVNQLNIYFEVLIPIIKEFGGFPDKYIGDAIVAIFGAPIYYEDHAEQAVRCCVEMQRALRRLNQERREQGLPVFEMRVGINSGDVIVGAIGCDMKLEYTSIGETTNLANRMETVCKVGHVMITAETHSRIPLESFRDVRIDANPITTRVKGYAEPVNAYNVYIDDMRIEKTHSDRLEDFYRYTEREELAPPARLQQVAPLITGEDIKVEDREEDDGAPQTDPVPDATNEQTEAEPRADADGETRVDDAAAPDAETRDPGSNPTPDSDPDPEGRPKGQP